MFSNRDKLQVVIGIALIFISFLIIVPRVTKFIRSKQAPIGSHNLTPFNFVSVIPGVNVIIGIVDPPPDKEIIVKMGDFGTQAVDGIEVGRFNTGNSRYIPISVDIPDELRDKPRVAVRIEADFNSYAYSWFNNQREAGIPPTTGDPFLFGFTPIVRVDNPQSYIVGQSRIVHLSLELLNVAGPRNNSVIIQDICFQAFLVSASFDIVPLSPECMSTTGNVNVISWDWSIRPKSDSSGKQELVFGVYGKMPNQYFVKFSSVRKDVGIEPQNIFEQIKQVKIDSWFTPITSLIAAFITLGLGIINLVPVFEKSSNKNKPKQLLNHRSDYLIVVPVDPNTNIIGVIRAATEAELKECKASFNNLIAQGQRFFSENGKDIYKSIAYLYNPVEKTWELSFLKHRSSQRIVKAKKYYEPCHPVQYFYDNGKVRTASEAL